MSWDARKIGQWAVAGVVVVGVVAGAVVLAQPSDSPGKPTATPTSTTASQISTAPGVDPSAKTLTLPIAESVWTESWQARETKNAVAYEASTCEKYIADETSLRRAADTADLLAAFEESKKYRPPWAIQDSELLDVDFQGGILGRLRTEATVTDNRNVPPTTDRRVVEYDMTYKDGRWKLCPSMTPLG